MTVDLADLCPCAEALAACLRLREPVRCDGCGATLRPPRASQPAPRAPKPSPMDSVARFVTDVLRWRLVELRAEGVARGGSVSGLYPVLRALELGVLGSGCSGTKGRLSEAPGADYVPVASDPAAASRYRALPREHQRVADLVADDGQGLRLAGLRVEGERVVQAPLEVRVGWRLASPDQRRRWAQHCVLGDTGPLILGAGQAGERALRAAALAWSHAP